jgi:hypothetical protein
VIGVGVRDVQRDAAADQPMHDAALRRRRRDRGRPAQVQRMVGEDQVEAPRDRLIDDGLNRVDREQHPPHARVGITAHQPDGIPRRRKRRRVARL